MSEDYETEETERTASVNRRSFVKSLGIAGGAAVFGAGVPRVSAQSTASEEQVTEALNSSQVQTILQALENPTVATAKATTQTSSLGSTTLSIVRLPTSAGEIIYGANEDGVTEAQFHFDSANSSALPKEYKNVPNRSEAILIGRPDSVLFGRMATTGEIRQIVARTDLSFDPVKAEAFTTTDIDGFILKFGTDEQAQTYLVELDGKRVKTTEVNELDATDSDVSIQANPPICNDADWCWRCVQAASGCGACTIACSNPVTVIGCALCIVPACGATGFACSACVDCHT